MPLDPQVRALLEEEAALALPPANLLSPEEARAQMESLAPPVDPALTAAVAADTRIPVAGGEIPVRLYFPAGSAPLPLVVFFHGGGWVLGSTATHDALCHALAHKSGCIVASIGYRLAPEHKYPTAAEDAYRAACWASENAEALGADARRIAVAGDSAGGNLAAVTALFSRERGGPRIALQVLVYPVTDRDFDTLSYRDNAEGYSLTRDLMIWFWEMYLASPQQGREPGASPLRAGDLAGLPQALILTAEYDPLRDEGEAYARALEAAGVPVALRRHDGMIHGFFRMTGRLDGARQALDEVAAALREKLC